MAKISTSDRVSVPCLSVYTTQSALQILMPVSDQILIVHNTPDHSFSIPVLHAPILERPSRLLSPSNRTPDRLYMIPPVYRVPLRILVPMSDWILMAQQHS
ncbi:hypothetical protein ACLOJK_036585 [Asimina triloba]